MLTRMLDRVKGLELLWKASKASNVHGAIATMTILQYYGNTVQFSDITPADTTLEDIQANCKKALHRVRNRYNSSPLWILEEARMEFVYGSVEKAVDILGGQYRCEMKQIEALMLFEKCMFVPQLLVLWRCETNEVSETPCSSTNMRLSLKTSFG